MKIHPKISVVLPVHNGEMYLKDSIESVLKQTYTDFELIIIDDNSTDSSVEIAQSYATMDSRVFYYRNEVNLKLPLSLNKGFSKTKGEFLTWTSCDNLYLPGAFEKMLSTLETNPKVDLVYTSMQIINENGNIKKIIKSGPADQLIFRNVVGACFMYRQSVRSKIGDYNSALFLCEDYEYWIRIAQYTNIYPMEECLYQYRRHSGSLSHKNKKEIVTKGIGIQKKYYHTFVKTRKQAAIFYTHLRARDIYNSFRHLYLFLVFIYNPSIFFKEIYFLIKRRFTSGA